MQVAGTVGDDGDDASRAALSALTSYLSRLTGETVLPGQPILLRSVHRAALSAWASKNGLSLDRQVLVSRLPIHPDALLGSLAANQKAAIPYPAGLLATPKPSFDPSPAIGIDIEDVAAMPVANDYREHPFYTANFSAEEIAHCIQQIDPRASFCGLWAAKEAMMKAGRITDQPFDTVSIAHDAWGRPSFSSCQISISHTASTAVAVCLTLPPTSMPSAVVSGEVAAVAPSTPKRASPMSARRLGILAGFLAALTLTALSFAISIAS